MPSQRRQINVRLSEESEARLKRLVERMRATVGIEVSQSDVIHAALAELEKRYPGDTGHAESPPTKKTARKRKG